MTVTYNEIAEEKQTLLEQQFFESPYGKQHYQQPQSTRTLPTKLNIFDFDSTLFLSPLLSNQLWDKYLINAITTEYLFGPGFWRDIRSLQFVPHDNVDDDHDDLKNKKEIKDWEGYWNEDIVQQVKLSMKDPNALTVLLTGRRSYPFSPLLEKMLLSKGLLFDIIGCRPDPFFLYHDHPLMKEKKNTMIKQKDIFSSTMDFKSCFILNLESKLPSLEEIIMWDDRPSQLPILNRFVEQLLNNDQHPFVSGKVISVKGIRPKYNPDWEYHLVESILNTHNQHLLDAIITTTKKMNGVINNNDDDDDDYCVAAIINEKGNIITSRDSVQLIKYSTSTKLLQLDSSCIGLLYQTFHPIYQQWIKNNNNNPSIPPLSYHYGEEPVYFGDKILHHVKIMTTLDSLWLSQEKNDKNDGSIEFFITGYYIGPFFNQQNDSYYRCSNSNDHIDGMVLQVKKKIDDDQYFILPLYYKPSQFSKLSTFDYTWINEGEYQSFYNHIRIFAKLDYLSLYGLEKKNKVN
ncbi:unnamed protein product [Cunninghamella blakesleeana]